MKKYFFKIVSSAFLLSLTASCTIDSTDAAVSTKPVTTGTVLLPTDQTPIKDLTI